MIILVSIETILLGFALLLIAGLLRSHAEILRRLPLEPSSVIDSALQGVNSRSSDPPSSNVVVAMDISGVDLDGRETSVVVSGRSRHLLLGFLTSGCGLCQDFWQALKSGEARVPESVDLALITKDREDESLSKLRSQAPVGVPIVMSTAGWEAHNIPVNPYFVLVDGSSGRILGEGAARAWDQVVSLLQDAIEEFGGTSTVPTKNLPSWREGDVDAILAAAGIGPNHPSLYDAHWSEDQVHAGEDDVERVHSNEKGAEVGGREELD